MISLFTLALMIVFPVAIGSNGFNNESTPSTRTYTSQNDTDISSTPKSYICKNKKDTKSIINFVIMVICIPVTIIGNGLVVLVILFTPALRRQPMYLYLASLGISDFIYGCLPFPIQAKIAYDALCLYLPKGFCWINMLVTPAIHTASVFHLFLIAIDRYLALKYTYEYCNMITRIRSLFLIAAVWMFSIVWPLLSIPQWGIPAKFKEYDVYFGKISIHATSTHCWFLNIPWHRTTLIGFALLPISLLVFLYSYVYLTAMRHVHEIAKLAVFESAEQVRRKKQMKLIQSIVVVFVSYFICWVPLAIWNLVNYDYSDEMNKHQNEVWFQVVSFIVQFFFPSIGSTLNPFIYVITNAAFVAAFHRLFTKMTGMRLKRDDDSIHEEMTKHSEADNHSYQLKVQKSHSKSPVNGIVNEAAFAKDE